MFSQNLIKALLDPSMDVWYPRTDIERAVKHDYKVDAQDDKILVAVPLPGYKADNIKISLEDSVLTISGESNHDVLGESSFKQRYSVGKNVDSDKVDSNLKDGVLTITLPKKEPSRRFIEIKS